MSNFFYNPVVGIDVSADFSMVAILKPNGDIYRKPFKVKHDVDGFRHLEKAIKKVEKEFDMKTVIFMESTGVYHLTLFHYLKNSNLEVYIINPLVTNSNKNSDIRKVKNDKKDALSIANLGKFQNIKAYSYFEISMFSLKGLCRDYYKLVDTRSVYKKKLSTDLRVIFPGYHMVFSDLTGVSSITLLKNYPSPSAILVAPKDDIIELLAKGSRKGFKWANATYNKLIKAAYGASIIGIPAYEFATKIAINISIIETFNKQIDNLKNRIHEVVKGNTLPEPFKKNLSLLLSIPGIGFISAVTILAEIGDLKNFTKSKQLVAFFGVDPGVNESGKFKGDKEKMSKRGTRFGRRALYAVALASVRAKRNGEANNKILLDYYSNNLKGKKRKVALVAIMHKLLNYIFAVLRNQREYEERPPKIHSQMHMRNSIKSVA